MNHTFVLNFPISIARSFPLKLKFNLKLFWITPFIFMIVILSFYIFQVNSLTRETYQVQNFQRKINELSTENEILEIKLTKLNSLVNIEALIDKSNFEKADKIHYIQISESQIVNPVRKGGELGSYSF